MANKEVKFNLSEKQIDMSKKLNGEVNNEFSIYKREDVKEFIRLLRNRILEITEDMPLKYCENQIGGIMIEIDKLAGDKLI